MRSQETDKQDFFYKMGYTYGTLMGRDGIRRAQEVTLKAHNAPDSKYKTGLINGYAQQLTDNLLGFSLDKNATAEQRLISLTQRRLLVKFLETGLDDEYC